MQPSKSTKTVYILFTFEISEPTKNHIESDRSHVVRSINSSIQGRNFGVIFKRKASEIMRNLSFKINEIYIFFCIIIISSYNELLKNLVYTEHFIMLHICTNHNKNHCY